MGIVIGTFALIIGLLALIFPKIFMNIFRGRGKGFHKENGKTKFEIARPPFYELINEKKAIMWARIFGLIILVISVFAYLSPSAP